jgi:3-oxoacyl-[acyl-carrier-protein] synthase-3
MEVFNFALKNVPTSLKNVLNKADLSLDEVDYCILHQANQLITDSIRKKLKSSTEKFPTSIQQYGNTSSASIPLTICSELKEQLSTQKLKLLLSGFGVGFSWATLLLNTEGVQTKLLEYE